MNHSLPKKSCRIPKIFILFMLFIFISGCSSIDTEKVRALDKVAVPLISVNKYIGMGGFNQLGSLIQRIAEDDKFDLQPAADKLQKRVYGKYSDYFPFQVMSEDQVLTTDKYKNFNLYDKERWNKSKFILTPNENYKNYHPRRLNRGERAKFLSSIPAEANAALFVYVDYNLVRRNIPMVPVSMAAVQAKVYLELVDRNGDQILKIRKKAESEEEFKAVAGVMLKPDNLQGMTIEATELAMAKVDEFVEKKMSK